MPSIKQLEAHIRALARNGGVKLRWVLSSRECLADYDKHSVLIMKVRSHHSYALALHELGHLLGPDQGSSKAQLCTEAGAWQWAQEQALVWGPAEQRTMVQGMKTYITDAVQSQERPLCAALRLPLLTHHFWVLVRSSPELTTLLAPLRIERRPHWLAREAPHIPWGPILNHTARPRCSNCAYWTPLARFPRGAFPTASKRWMGTCAAPEVPLGVESTPSGALCGTSWVLDYEQKN